MISVLKSGELCADAESPGMQREAVTAATDRTCALYNLDQLNSFVLFAASQCPPKPPKILLDGPNNKVKLRQAAYLLTQFMNETTLPVRVLTAKTVMTCAEECLNTLIEQFLPQGFLCDKDWIRHAHTGSFTIPKLALCYAHYLTNISGDDLFNSHSPSCFLDLWIAMLEAGVRADISLQVETRDHSGYEGLTALEILQALMSRILRGFAHVKAPWNKVSGGASSPHTNASCIDAVAARCCRIDELSVSTCGTAQSRFAGLAENRAAASVSGDAEYVATRGLKRGSDHNGSPEANKRPRQDNLTVSLKPSPWAIHQLRYTLEERPKADEGGEV